MKKSEAETLVDYLAKHPEVSRFTIDKKIFFDDIINLDLESTKKFYSIIESNSQVFDESGITYVLSLDLLLKNENAKNYSKNKFKAWLENFVNKYSIYNPIVLSRKIREESFLVDKMLSSSSPYSLLARMEMYYPEELHTRPLLIVPGEDPFFTYDWESNNTIRIKEVKGIFGVIQKRINI